MRDKISFHSICAWTFNPGKGGFVPADMRPAWAGLKAEALPELIAGRIRPRLPDNVRLGLEVHYDAEVNEDNAATLAASLGEQDLHLAMVTPGAHAHYAYGGPASLDEEELASARDFGRRTLELAYGPLRPAWHPQRELAPTLVLWNGSYGYDLATPAVAEMYRRLKESIADLCAREEKAGGELYIAIEPKPNEGHPAMLLPTVASVLLFWRRLAEGYDIALERKGVNKEFGHSEMIGLDHVYDTVEEIDCGGLVHMHLNSQGYNDGIIYGGPGKYDIDHGTRINGMNIAVAGLVAEAGYRRWKGHDMQPRPYDSEEQALDRVVRSILSWEACAEAAVELDREALLGMLAARQTARAEDLMRGAVVRAQQWFDRAYGGA